MKIKDFTLLKRELSQNGAGQKLGISFKTNWGPADGTDITLEITPKREMDIAEITEIRVFLELTAANVGFALKESDIVINSPKERSI